MTWFPLSAEPAQYENASGVPYSGAVLKAYEAGTSTPISMATDYTGGVTATSFALNASGYPISGAAVIIPHIQENYKLCLYPTQAAADANAGALWSVDNIQVSQSANATRYINYAADTGAANAYVIAPDPAISAYSVGQVVTLLPTNTNTTASTLVVSGLTSKNIKKSVSGTLTALTAGDIRAGVPANLMYDGTQFVMLNGNGALDSLSDAAVDYTILYNMFFGTGVGGATPLGSNNTAAGVGALSGVSTAASDANAAYGYYALNANTSGGYNTAVGAYNTQLNTTGSANTSLGYGSLAANIAADNNTAVGYNVLSSSTGAGNTAVGYSAGSAGTANITGTNNTFIGYSAQANGNAYTNSTAIGNGAIITASNTMQLGNASLTTVFAGTGNVASVKALNTAKAWGQVSVSGGTPTLNKAFNMTSITDTNTGILTCTIATDCDDALYVILPGISLATNTGTVANNGTVVVDNTATAAIAAGAFVLYCWNKTATTNTLIDPMIWHFGVFGTQ